MVKTLSSIPISKRPLCWGRASGWEGTLPGYREPRLTKGMLWHLLSRERSGKREKKKGDIRGYGMGGMKEGSWHNEVESATD